MKQYHQHIKSSYAILLLSILVSTGACKRFLEIPPPPNQLAAAAVFADDKSATAALDGIYSNMMQSSGLCIGQLSLNLGLAADELTNYSTDAYQVQFYENAIAVNNSRISIWWGSGTVDFYSFIYAANAAIEGLNSSTAVSHAVKQELLGEATFIRAFAYFYLVNLFGNVPVTMTTDYSINNRLTQSPQPQVMEQIISDLKEAQTLLNADYTATKGARVKPTRMAATALLARVYLYNQNWSAAADQATAIVSNPTFSLPDLNDVFLSGSTEAIWQLMPVAPGYNTWDGTYFVLTARPDWAALSATLLSAFEVSDKRKDNWVGLFSESGTDYYYANKYKVKNDENVTEYYVVFRLAEQYLIRAEARAQQDNLSGAQDDLNTIRTRAGLPNTTANTKADLLTAILHERQVEFFCEFGQRWFDLKRTGQAQPVLSVEKPGWNATDTLFPIYQPEILNNPNIKQNAGYN